MRVAGLLMSAGLAGALTGCSGSGSDDITPPPLAGDVLSTAPAPVAPSSSPAPASGASETTAAAASTSSTLAPVDPAQEASAVAFVKEYFTVYNAAASSPATSRLRQYSAPGCSDCEKLAAGVEEYARRGEHQAGPALRATTVRSDFAPGRTVVLAAFQQLPGRLVNAKGEVTGSIPAGRDQWAFHLVRSGATWKVQRINRYQGQI